VLDVELIASTANTSGKPIPGALLATASQSED
jgi:hypothetical protein